METIKEIALLLNPWWKEGYVNEELAKKYKRDYFNRISDLISYRQIIILSGLRRVGKTTLMYQIIENLLEKNNQKNIFYFNFDKTVEDLTKILDAYSEITKIEWKKEKVFVFLDEIAKLKNWADKIKLLYDAFPNIKFIVSSSSSTSLESEAIQNLAGRYFLLGIKPLYFIEYIELKNKKEYLENPELWKKEIKKEIKDYLLRSFPEIINWEDELLVKDYLRTTIIDKVVKDDLPNKFKNINKDLILRLLEIFYSEPGIYLDYDSISKKFGVSKKTLIEHVFYLEFSYLIRKVKNLRPSIMSTSRKMQRIYPYWWSLAFCYSDNYDKIIENAIASLIDAKYYWRKNKAEIDFLLMDKKKIVPIEVKNKEEIKKADIENIRYFIRKYKIKRGIVIYQGEKENEEESIRFLPFWKLLLNIRTDKVSPL